MPTRTISALPRPESGTLTPDTAPHSRYAPTADRPVRVRLRRLQADTRLPPHRHAWAQVAISDRGVIRTSAEHNTYLVPPSRAVWIPPDVEHAVNVVEDADLRTLYIHQDERRIGPGGVPEEEAAAWRQVRVLEVSPLLHELALQLPTEADPGPVTERERWIGALVQDELRHATTLALGIALPADKRLRALCEAVLADPARFDSLTTLAHDAGASARTVARLFRSELGTTFVQWRHQVLLARALSMAARGLPMARIAGELGYASASAFSAMVRRSVGLPPSRLFAEG